MTGTPLEMLGIPIEWGPFWLWWLDWCLYAYGWSLLFGVVFSVAAARLFRAWWLVPVTVLGWLLFCYVKQGWVLG